MKFKEWKQWYRSLPKSMRWFVFLIFLRPLIDNFFYLKEVSPFLSPLYIVGILTPILILYSTWNKKLPYPSTIDPLFKIWGAIIILGIVCMGFYDYNNLQYFIFSLKIAFPIYLYWFLRYFIRSLKDLEGVLQTFLYSAPILVAIFLYELFVHPINPEISREMERMQGGYGDIFNYATYLCLGTIINFYFLLKKDTTTTRFVRIRNAVIMVILALTILFNINHTASYGVFASIIIIYLIISLGRNSIVALGLIGFVVLIGYLFGQEIIEKKITPLIQTDINVYSGDVEKSYALHGRVGRWESFLDDFDKSSLLTHLLGFPVTTEKPYKYIIIGPHNDYLRILFCTGYIGLIIYISILYSIFKKVIMSKLAFLYLGLSSLSSIILYSISSTPTMYTSFMYVVFSIFAFFALPKKIRFASA